MMPLKNLRVVNFGWIWAAPALAGAMADMGAEVIKVETRRRVDNTRRSAANYKEMPLMNHSSLTLLRDVRSITLDLDKPESTAIAMELISTADVAIENYKPGTISRWGLGYDTLRKARPDLIMISLSSGGQWGPLSGITTFGSALSCLTGIESMTGYREGGPPQTFGTALIDPFIGYLGLLAVLSALRERERTGKGQYIDLCQWEAAATIVGSQLLDYQWNGRIAGMMGNRDLAMAPHGLYPCTGYDAWLAIAIEHEEQWRALRRAMGDPAWARESRFSDMYRRLRNQDSLDEYISKWTKDREAMETAAMLQSMGVPAFPAQSDEEAFTNRHFLSREGWVEVQHPFGPITVNGIHWKLGKTPGEIRKATPMLGQDNEYVFMELMGKGLGVMNTMESQGAIA